MPTIPALTRAIFTSSSLKGRMMASIFFMEEDWITGKKALERQSLRAGGAWEASAQTVSALCLAMARPRVKGPVVLNASRPIARLSASPVACNDLRGAPGNTI
jgi:hypothetical protein